MGCGGSLYDIVQCCSEGELQSTHRNEPKRNLLMGPMYAAKRQYTKGRARTAAWRRPRTMKRGMITLSGDMLVS